MEAMITHTVIEAAAGHYGFGCHVQLGGEMKC
jgi:hypothetical protein